ncbi:MAG: hypothetical protein HKP59_08830 [Lutibacter sp.]|uniref:hypothetical protein n=1 Tax=Lutibacter sp. TaxID=1925666 RepID=UPI0017AE6477|nr:hypothetical protein [Lutibacter sp.]MBT8317720.1 hypothetical protein [Lutibacter sp.]NNJ58578.1 hypothetical protein [Lutibacter sp.]
MKFFVKKIVAIVFLLFLTIGCLEEIDIDEGENPNTNNSNSETTNHYKRIGMHDGSFDDIIDNNSCNSVVLPVSLLANNTPLTLSSSSDYQLVIDIFNLTPINTDTIVFNFPITIMNQDYSQISITNASQLDDLSTICDVAINTNLSAINCVDIIYPINISLFNTNTNQTTIISIDKDQDLFNFMANLSINEAYSVQYPIKTTITGNVNLTVSSDSELKSIINDCIN